MNLYSILILLLIPYLISCSSDLSTINYKTKTHLISHSKTEFKYFLKNTNSNFFLFNKGNKTIEIWDKKKNSISSEISLNEYFENSHDFYQPLQFRYKICLKNEDSIYILESEQMKRLHLIDSKNSQHEIINLDSILLIHSTDSFYTPCRPNSRPIFHGDFLYLNLVSYNVALLPKGNKNYFKSPKILKYNIKTGSSKLLFVDFPKSYFENYFDYMYSPLLAIKDSQSFYTAFSYADLVQINNINGLKKSDQVRSSKSGDYIPYLTDSITNMNYSKNYWITAPENKNIYYSENRNHLYIIKEHQIPLEKNEFEFNTEADKSWSVIVADTNLNKIHEFIFDKSDIRNENFFVDQDGFSLLKYDRTSSKDSITVWKYYYTYE